MRGEHMETNRSAAELEALAALVNGVAVVSKVFVTIPELPGGGCSGCAAVELFDPRFCRASQDTPVRRAYMERSQAAAELEALAVLVNGVVLYREVYTAVPSVHNSCEGCVVQGQEGPAAGVADLCDNLRRHRTSPDQNCLFDNVIWKRIELPTPSL